MKTILAVTLSLAFLLAPLAKAQTGHSDNDLRGTWTAGSLTAVAIITQATLQSHSNNAVAWCVDVTNGIGVTTWTGDITNITPNQVGGSFGSLIGSNTSSIFTNVDNNVTNANTGGIVLGTNNYPAVMCRQIDGLTEEHTVWAVGVGAQAAGTWAVTLRQP